MCADDVDTQGSASGVIANYLSVDLSHAHYCNICFCILGDNAELSRAKALQYHRIVSDLVMG